MAEHNCRVKRLNLLAKKKMVLKRSLFIIISKIYVGEKEHKNNPYNSYFNSTSWNFKYWYEPDIEIRNLLVRY